MPRERHEPPDEDLLGPLDEREREILRLRFGLDRGEPRTLEQVAQHFHLTRERIRQIEAKAMSKLRTRRSTVEYGSSAPTDRGQALLVSGA